MRIRRPAGLPVLLLGALVACTALAGKAVAAPTSAAKSDGLVKRGEAALDGGDLAAAEQNLSAAYKQDPRADLLFQLGRLAAAQGQLLTAQDLFRRYLNDPTITPDALKTAAAQKVLAEPRPPSGKVRVQGDRGGFVLVDGRVLGRLPLVQPLLTTPGAHTIAIAYPGKALDVPVDVIVGRMVDIRCTRATGAIVLSMLPALLVLPELAGVSPATTELFLDAVERAAQGEQLTILKPESVTTLTTDLSTILQGSTAGKAPVDLTQCLAQPDCLQRLLQKTKLEYALRVHATAASGPDPSAPSWDLTVELLHASIFGAASTQTQSCAACTDQKAATLLQDAVSRTLAVGLLRPRGTLAVTSQPADAEVWQGDHLLGKTPLSLPAWVGEYALALRLSGHEPVQRTLQVQAGKTTEVAANLPETAPPPKPVLVEKAPPPAPLRSERGPRPRWRIIVGAVVLAAGVGLTIGGAYQAGLHLTTVCGPVQPPTGQVFLACSPGPAEIAETKETGQALASVGSLITLGGIGLIAFPGPRRLVRAAPASNPQ